MIVIFDPGKPQIHFYEQCPACWGHGVVRIWDWKRYPPIDMTDCPRVPCADCHGLGRVLKSTYTRGISLPPISPKGRR